MPVETAGEFFLRHGEELVEKRRGAHRQRAIHLIAFQELAAQAMEQDPLAGLRMMEHHDEQRSGLVAADRRLDRFSQMLQGLLAENGLDRMQMVTQAEKPVEILPPQPVIPTPEEKQIHTPHQYRFDLAGVIYNNLSLWELLALSELSFAPDQKTAISVDALAQKVRPGMEEERARALLQNDIHSLREKGIDIQTHRLEEDGKKAPRASYYIPGKIEVILPDKVAGSGSNQEDELISGDLTFSEEAMLVLGCALRLVYMSYKQRATLEAFGITMTKGDFDRIHEEVVGDVQINLQNPRFSDLPAIFREIAAKITSPNWQDVLTANDQRVRLLLSFFQHLGKADLKKSVSDILGDFTKAVHDSQQSTSTRRHGNKR